MSLTTKEGHIMRKLIAASVALFLAMLGLTFVATAAQADTTTCDIETTGWVTEQPAGKGWQLVDTRTVVDEEAWTEEIVISEPVPGQHYSLKGNSGIGKDEIPPTPEENPDIWQANTEQEPHDNGQGTPVTWYPVDPATSGLHYASHGSEGLRDWFYYRAPVPGEIEVIEHEAVTHDEYKYEREVCTTVKDPDPKPEPEPKPEPKPEPEPQPTPDKPELPKTGAGSTALLALIGTSLIGAGTWLSRRFS